MRFYGKWVIKIYKPQNATAFILRNRWEKSWKSFKHLESHVSYCYSRKISEKSSTKSCGTPHIESHQRALKSGRHLAWGRSGGKRSDSALSNNSPFTNHFVASHAVVFREGNTTPLKTTAWEATHFGACSLPRKLVGIRQRAPMGRWFTLH